MFIYGIFENCFFEKSKILISDSAQKAGQIALIKFSKYKLKKVNNTNKFWFTKFLIKFIFFVIISKDTIENQNSVCLLKEFYKFLFTYFLKIILEIY